VNPSAAQADRTASLPENRLGPIAPAVAMPAAIVGVALAAISMLLPLFGVFGIEWSAFLRSYLFAFEFVLSICLGALFFVMLQHCVKAGWSVSVRRLAEGLAGNLQWIWILFIPIALGMLTGNLYDWQHTGEAADAAAKYQYYLTPKLWLLRAAIFLASWALIARFFVRTSIAQDATGEVSLTRRMEKFAPLCMLIYGVTQSYAAMDWVMSLESAWFSTMFPVYFFAASCCGFFATLILLGVNLQRMGRLTHSITTEHYQDLGKLLFAFGIVFWAYIAYSQYMLIWYANIPEEVPFYLVRQEEGWLAFSLLLLFGHFVAPFLAIISRHPKRRPAMLAIAALWMLFMAAIDIYWLVMPDVPDDLVHSARTYAEFQEKATPEMVNSGLSILDFTCLLGLGALALAGTFRQLGKASLLPEHDPRLHEALAFENF
jgi:hypothetical protein